MICSAVSLGVGRCSLRGREERSANPVAPFVSNRRTHLATFGVHGEGRGHGLRRLILTQQHPTNQLGLTARGQLSTPMHVHPPLAWIGGVFATTASPLGSGWRTYESSQLARPIDLAAPPSGQEAF